MQFTAPDGRIIEATTPGQVAYYRREPGYEELAADAAPVETDDNTETETETDSGEQTSDVDTTAAPAASASKRDWYDYAATLTDDLPEYDAITQAELMERYGSSDE